MLRKRIVEFLGLESVIHWLGARISRDNVNATATVVLALATIALSASTLVDATLTSAHIRRSGREREFPAAT